MGIVLELSSGWVVLEGVNFVLGEEESFFKEVIFDLGIESGEEGSLGSGEGKSEKDRLFWRILGSFYVVIFLGYIKGWCFWKVKLCFCVNIKCIYVKDVI